MSNQDIRPNEVINNFNINGLTDDMSTPIDNISNDVLPDRNMDFSNINEPLGNRDVSLRDRDVSLRDRDVSLRDRDVSLRDRDVSLRDRDVSLEDKNYTMPPNNIFSTNINTKTHYITIDSRYRNLELYENPSNFQIMFDNIYSNVKSISLVHCSIPNIDITSYLKLYIDELPSNFITIGSNDKYFTKLILDNSNSSGIYCNVKSVCDEFHFEETSLGVIDKMTCNIQTAFNTPLLEVEDKVSITHMEQINGNVKVYFNKREKNNRLNNNDIIYIYNTTPSITDRISFDKDIIISAMDIIEYKNEK